ncbi:MAG: SEC-C metal-binding domain-containing protein [Luteolibacter sp.]
MGAAYRSKPRLHLTTEQEEVLLDYVMMLASGKKVGGNHGLKGTDDADFVIRNRTIRVGDPCPCRSGKPYKDCHGKNDIPPESEGLGLS